MANSFSSSTLTAERFLVPIVAQLGNNDKGTTGNENASDNEDEVLSVGGVSQPPSPQSVVTSSMVSPTLSIHPRLDNLQTIRVPSEPVSYKSVGQNETLELDHKLGSQPRIRLTDVETHLDATDAVQVSPAAIPVQASSPSLLHEDMELPRRSPLSGPDRSSSPLKPDIDPGECTSPQPSAALKFSIDNILNPNFGRTLLPGTTANALGRELLHRHPHLYCHPLLTAAKEMLLAVTAAEMCPTAGSGPASNYSPRENNHHYFNPHLAALQINNSLLNQSQGTSTSADAAANTSSKKGNSNGNALYANWRNNRPDPMSSLTPPSSSGIVMDLSIRSSHGNNAGYAAGGSLSSPSHGSASPGGISTCSNSSSGDCSSQLFAAATGAAASQAATGSGKLAAHSGDLLSAASTPAKPESSSDSTGTTQQNLLWPAWVYCTRYSDRPSSGRSPRARRIRKKDKKPDEKRPRTAFTAEQLARLKTEFNENRYLTEKRRQDLARELQLHENQIKIWFQNKRAKMKKASGQKNPLALQLMAQGLYNHSTIPLRDDEDIDSME